MGKYENTRPCITWQSYSEPQRALFHGWSFVAEIFAPSIRRGGHPGGQVANTFALVEYDDGCVEELPVNKILFLDSPESFAVYDWEALAKALQARDKEREERRNGTE